MPNLNDKLVSEQWLITVNLTLGDKFQLNFYQNITIFINENAFENAISYMLVILSQLQWVNTLRPRKNGHYFPEVIFKCIFLNENV